ncbi:uncharacterized protein LOC113311678 [Papaver somniferum]|uniref:uncharacterized protein LOC113311678 n=1 Tax=Papaver somniferum TaxID=3469 RepID=UPI000E6FBF9E|nr:uncharacterized protein LOC113311678 [Papaver somniferum]
MTAIFHDMMHKQVQDYVDDIVVKSRARADHTGVLRQVFERCLEYKLKMNPLKCAFGVSSGKFMGFHVTAEGIKLVASFTPLLKKGSGFVWTAAQQEAFGKIQRILSSPAIMKSLVQVKPLCLYTAFSDTAVGALLAREDDEGIERPIYYFIRILRDAELRYPKTEKACLDIIYSIQKFRHYLLSNKVVLISKSDPAKFLLSKPVLMGRTAKCLLQMSELDITCASLRVIKGKSVADLLAAFPGEGTTGLHEDLPGEFPDISVVEEEVWLLYFDGSATPRNNTGGAGVVLVSPNGEVFSHSFKMDFQCTHNSAEYEAFLIRLSIAKQAGVTRLGIRGDSKLLVNQVNGVYVLKELTLAPYRSEAQRLLNYFSDATIIHVGRINNKHADFLATLASKLKFEGLEETLTVKRITIVSKWLSQYKETKICDWRTPIIQELSSSLSQGKVILKTLQNFVMLHGMLYHRNPDGPHRDVLGMMKHNYSLIAFIMKFVDNHWY